MPKNPPSDGVDETPSFRELVGRLIDYISLGLLGVLSVAISLVLLKTFWTLVGPAILSLVFAVPKNPVQFLIDTFALSVVLAVIAFLGYLIDRRLEVLKHD